VYSSNYPQKNALININTVANSPLWDNDAKYFYYAHGPLARVEYGDNKVQGQDYAYTLQGWIKGVNSNTLDTARDMGKDGAIGSVNSIFAKDAFGYTLNYHTNDYKAIDGLKWNNANNRFESIIAGSDLNNSRNDLFNGNITSMVTTIVPPTLPKTDSVAFSPLPQGTAYRYDQLNRLVEMKAWQNLNPITNTWGSGLPYNGMYHNQFTYDANGSLLTAMANNQAGQTIDNQIYHHQTINGKKFSNRTYAITDSATITSGNDLLNQIRYTNNTDSVNSFNNYSYTEIGERTSDKQDSIALITWNVYGKIDSVARISGSSKYNLKFDYDAMQKRISKKVYTSNNTWLYTEYYIRDAQSNLMSTYKHQVIDSTSSVSFAQTEKEIYGKSELGVDVTKTEMISTLPVSNIFTRTLDKKHYTGSNHLDNVLVTFTDRKLPIDADNNGIIDSFWPDVIASNDYMPFGALMTERTFKKGTFPNSFNGKRDDEELKGQDYGMREYIPEEREFPTIDPITHKYPHLTPYQFAANTPISCSDLDGKESEINIYGSNNKGQVFHKVVSWEEVHPGEKHGPLGNGSLSVVVRNGKIDEIRYHNSFEEDMNAVKGSLVVRVFKAVWNGSGGIDLGFGSGKTYKEGTQKFGKILGHFPYEKFSAIMGFIMTAIPDNTRPEAEPPTGKGLAEQHKDTKEQLDKDKENKGKKTSGEEKEDWEDKEDENDSKNDTTIKIKKPMYSWGGGTNSKDTTMKKKDAKKYIKNNPNKVYK